VAISQRDDLSAMLYKETELGQEALYLSLSDAVGKNWTAPVRIDGDLSGAAKSLNERSVLVFGDSIHLAWLDYRHGNAELYTLHSQDRGQSWSAETIVPKGQTLGAGEVTDWLVEASPRNVGADSVYALMKVSQPSGFDALLFTSSLDGGLQFAAPHHVPTAFSMGHIAVGKIAMEAPREEGDVYLSWQDDRSGGRDVYFQHSPDRGSTWLPVARQMNTTTGNADGELDLSEAGFRVQVAWTDSSLAPGAQRLMVDWSEDRGQTWRPTPEQVGGYVPGQDQVSQVQCLRNRQLLTVLWVDDRTGREEAYIASWDPGVTNWREYPLSTTGASEIQVIGHRNYMAAVWLDQSNPPQILASTSRDKGESWTQSPFAATSTLGKEAMPRLGFSKAYGNFLLAWTAEDSGSPLAHVGGFRGPAVEAHGTFRVQSPLSFSINHFPETETNWPVRILLAHHSGVTLLPFGDGRALGLAPDSLFRQTATAQALSPLLAQVDSLGNGLAPGGLLPPSIHAGEHLYFLAISMNPLGGFGHLSDVRHLEILP